MGRYKQPGFRRNLDLWSLACRGVMGLFFALGPAACYDVGVVTEDKTCTPGHRNCVCDPTQSCSLGLECRRDRCVDPLDAGASTDTKPDEAATSSSDQSKDPSPDGDDDPNKSSDATNEEPDARCDDSIQNGEETDLDCGGSQCMPCVIGQRCLEARDCRSKQCEGERCVGEDPECISDSECDDKNPCTLDRCISNACEQSSVPEGTSCDDKSACTVGDQCEEGECKGASAVLMEENFDTGKKYAGWSFQYYGQEASARSTWEIGRARASGCGAEGGFGEDPALDHSEGHRNRVLGTDVGGCHNHGFSPAWDCVWTPDLDASILEDDIEFSFWRHLHAPPWETGAHKPRGVRHRVVYRLKSNNGEKLLEMMDGDFGFDEIDWSRQSYIVPRPPKGGPQEISLGICYQRAGKIDSFAGWSVDDVLVRQKGCKEGR